MPWGTLFGSWISGSGICANFSFHSGFARPPCCTLARAAPLPGRLNWIVGFSLVAGGFPPWSCWPSGRTLFLLDTGTVQPATRSGFILKRPRDVLEHCKSLPSVCLSVCLFEYLETTFYYSAIAE